MYAKGAFLLNFLWISKVLAYNLQIPDGETKTVSNVNFDLSQDEIMENYSEFERKLFETFLKERSMLEIPKSTMKDSREAFNFLETKRNLLVSTTTPPPEEESTKLESWSVVWYIASFSGLIAFFLVVSCSEWCCRRNGRNNAMSSMTNSPNQPTISPETPPPSYDLFAPPSYDSLSYGRNGEKNEYDIYVVPVHALGPIVESTLMEGTIRNDSPPPYATTRQYELPPMERRQNLHNDQHVIIT